MEFVHYIQDIDDLSVKRHLEAEEDTAIGVGAVVAVVTILASVPIPLLSKAARLSRHSSVHSSSDSGSSIYVTKNSLSSAKVFHGPTELFKLPSSLGSRAVMSDRISSHGKTEEVARTRHGRVDEIHAFPSFLAIL